MARDQEVPKRCELPSQAPPRMRELILSSRDLGSLVPESERAEEIRTRLRAKQIDEYQLLCRKGAEERAGTAIRTATGQVHMLWECWHEEKERRPTFMEVDWRLKRLDYKLDCMEYLPRLKQDPNPKPQKHHISGFISGPNLQPGSQRVASSIYAETWTLDPNS
eukprot:3436948-Rhodomonas_salina.1